jgi:subtilisin family serine protease
LVKIVRSARLLGRLTVVALVACAVPASLGLLPPAVDVDSRSLASVREIQERVPDLWVERVAEQWPEFMLELEGDDPSVEVADPEGRPQLATRQTYIVTLDEDLQGDLDDFAGATGGDVVHLYRSALTGFAVDLVPEAAEALRSVEQVRSVEADQPVDVDVQTTPNGVNRVADPTVASSVIPSLSIDARDDVRVDADIAVLDTGVADHPDLDVVARTDCTSSFSGCADGRGEDGSGHGTHVAGTAAAIDNNFGTVGVAPGARVHSVKVLGDDGLGTFSDVIAGIDWATARSSTIDVINLSLSGEGQLSALDQAIDEAVDVGITVVASAGNSAKDARNTIPANHPDVLAVSALADANGIAGGGRGYCEGPDDHLATFSNFGAVVDVIAPGTCIYSTLPGGYGTMSGTSMSSPHVAGAAAILATKDMSVPSIRSAILGAGNSGWTDTSGDGRKEPLLDLVGADFAVAATVLPTTTTSTSTTSTSTTSTTTVAPTTTTMVPAEGNQPPTAAITYQCRRSACILEGSSSSDSDGEVRSYAWDFGDGSAASGSRVRHAYGSAGTFLVSLTVVDDDGAADRATRSLTCSPSRSSVLCR